MHIPPNQRRRAIQVHYLRQHGHSLRQIAEQQNLSPDIVRSDLKLVETHWSSIAAAAADDLLLESLQLLRIRLSLAIKNDDVANNAERLTPVEYLRARDAQETRLNNLAREIRRTAQDVHRRAAQRADQPDLYDDVPQEPAENTPELVKTDHPDHTISSPGQEIVESKPQQEKIPAETAHLPDLPDLPEYDPLIEEVFDEFPHLRGQSTEQILAFLDQLTDPDGQASDIPTEIYAEAAG